MDGKTMRIVSYKAALVAVLILGLIPLQAALGAGRLQVVAFGDSLLDAGTYSLFADPTFGGGRFTTNPGLNFTQDVALHYGDTLTPAFLGGFGRPLFPAGGLDYAQGGSRVTMQPGIYNDPNAPFALQTTIPVQDQVNDEYLRAHQRFTSDQLVLINGGANDFFFQFGIAGAAGFTAAALLDAEGKIAQSAIDLANVVATVIENGATHVVVINLPDIGKTPFGASPPQGVSQMQWSDLLTQISQGFNSTLKQALHQEKFRGKVILIDAFKYIDGIVDHPSMYGLSNTALACDPTLQLNEANEAARQPGLAAQLQTSNPSLFKQIFAEALFCSPSTYTTDGADYKYIFADMVHPTTRVNALFAQFVEQQIAMSRWEFSEPAMAAQ